MQRPTSERGSVDRDTRRTRERRLFTSGPRGPISVCLVYPNTYPVAMANLGFQAVYRLFDRHPGVTVERAYLPDGPRSEWPRRLRSFESERPLADFDVLAFSISFETDYVHVLDCLALAGLPLERDERGPCAPLVLAGGPATFLNPEPLADFVDLFLIGEAEEMLPEFLAEALAAEPGRDALMAAGERVAGGYRPSRFTPRYDAAGDLCGLDYDGPGDGRVARRYVADLDATETASQVLTPEAVFGDMFMVEASRGCEWGCRFCAAGFMYRPVRYRSAATLRAPIARGLVERRTIGLVGAEMASQPGIASLCREIAEAGGRPSPSSLKADVITPALARALGAAGNRSVTVAPEAGSERLRRVINKNLTEPEILRAAEWLVGGGAPRVGRILVSINPFVPKPWTPFQWEPMEDLGSLRRKLGSVRRQLAALPATQVETESPREGYLQTLLSRGDRRAGALLRLLHERPDDWWGTLRRLRGGRDGVVDPDRFVHRAADVRKPLPWDFIDHGVDKRYLLAERRKAFAELQTPPCDTHTCHACNAC